MKVKTCHTILAAAVALALFAPISAFSQEDRGFFESETPSGDKVKQDPESPSGTENPEAKSKNNTPAQQEPIVVRDSEIKSQKQPAPKAIEKPQKDDEKVQKQEEDPLSFNFLYYIIEKFKFSDIVE